MKEGVFNLVFLVFICICFLPLVSAENIGKYKVDEPMEITNYCQAGDCSYVTLISLEIPNGTITYPDTNMTNNSAKTFNYSYTPDQIGLYKFVTCGDSEIVVCDNDEFDVTYSGKDTFVGANIIILIFFLLLLAGIIKLNHKINYDKWYGSILNKYKGKNYVKVGLSSVAYNLMKNTFGIYYLFGFPVLLIITDIILTYNIQSLIGIIEALMYIYTWGVILVGVMFVGQLQEFIKTLIDDFKNIQWGINQNE